MSNREQSQSKQGSAKLRAALLGGSPPLPQALEDAIPHPLHLFDGQRLSQFRGNLAPAAASSWWGVKNCRNRAVWPHLLISRALASWMSWHRKHAESNHEDGADAHTTLKPTFPPHRRGSSGMSDAERWKNAAAQLVYSPAARFYYALMIVVTLFEICATLLDPHVTPHSAWLIGLELFMVAMLLIEVIVRYIADGNPRTFFSSRSNIFDVVVAKV